MISRSIYNLKIDTIYMYDIPFDRSFLQLSNGIRHITPSTDRKLELTAKASMAQPVSQPAVCSNGLRMVRPTLYNSRSTVIRYMRRNFVHGFMNIVISLDTRCPKSHPFYVSFVKHAHNEQCFNDKL